MSKEPGLKERGWEAVQIKAFTQWLNSYLNKRELEIKEIKSDLADGVKLLNFLELLSGKKVTTKYDRNPPSRIQKIQNLHIALNFLEKDLDFNVKVVGVGAEDFADENLKMILGFLWSLFKRYRISVIKQDDKSSEEGLLLWCQKTTAGYKDVSISNFKHGFRSGLGFLALCDKFIENKEILDFDKFSKDAPIDNLNAAFEAAEKHLGIPKLLDADEVSDGSVDDRSLVLYVSLYFHAFVAQQQQKALANEKDRLAEQMRGLEGSLEERANKAASLQNENAELKKELEALKAQLKAEIEAKNELAEKETYLEQKVEVLKQLLEQENEEKVALETSKRTLQQEVDALTQELTSFKSKSTDLSENKFHLEQQVASLTSQVQQLSTKLEKDTDEFTKREKAEIGGLNELKKHLEYHIEDLHRWQKYLDYDKQSEVDFSGEIRPQILQDIRRESYEEQLRYISNKLDKENQELTNYLKAKEEEAQAKKAQEKKKKDRQKKNDN